MFYLRDTLTLPVKGLRPSAHPFSHQPARREWNEKIKMRSLMSCGELKTCLDWKDH